MSRKIVEEINQVIDRLVPYSSFDEDVSNE